MTVVEEPVLRWEDSWRWAQKPLTGIDTERASCQTRSFEDPGFQTREESCIAIGPEIPHILKRPWHCVRNAKHGRQLAGLRGAFCVVDGVCVGCGHIHCNYGVVGKTSNVKGNF